MDDLPPTKLEGRKSLDERVDQIADDFENAWMTGQRPRLEDYLGDSTGEMAEI